MESILLTYIQNCPDFVISNLGKISEEVYDHIFEVYDHIFDIDQVVNPPMKSVKLIPKDLWDTMRVMPISQSKLMFYIFEN